MDSINKPKCPHPSNFDYHSGYQQALTDIKLLLEDAYLAGIFDGEGCVYFHPDGYPRLTVVNTHFETVRRFRDRFGGSVQEHGPKMKQWVATGKDALRASDALMPFLIIKHGRMHRARSFNFGLKPKK